MTSVFRPYCEVQIVGLDGTTYTNQTSSSASGFLRVKQVRIKGSSVDKVKKATVTLLNKSNNATNYNAAIAKNTATAYCYCTIWVGVNDDGSDKVKRFFGSCTARVRNLKQKTSFIITPEFSDGTTDLLNASVQESITPGETKTGGDGGSYVMNDYATLVKYLMSFTKYNPKAINATTYVVNTGTFFGSVRVWAQKQMSEVFNDIKAQTGFVAYVDENNRLHFEPAGNNINATTLTTDGSSPNLEEFNDRDDDLDSKNLVLVYAGATTDGNKVIGRYAASGASASPKTVWRSNTDIAPNVTGSTSAERTANAKAAANEYAKQEFNKISLKKYYTAVLNQYVPISTDDVMLVTCADYGFSSQPLRVKEVEETIDPLKAYKATLTLVDL